MSETVRWVLALVVSVAIAFGGNYWITTINQATMNQQIVAIYNILSVYKEDISNLEDLTDKHTTMINNNATSNIRVTDVAVALATTTKDLNKSVTALTEVVIRLEERDKLKK